jgi:hypothetical protein
MSDWGGYIESEAKWIGKTARTANTWQPSSFFPSDHLKFGALFHMTHVTSTHDVPLAT